MHSHMSPFLSNVRRKQGSRLHQLQSGLLVEQPRSYWPLYFMSQNQR